MDLLNGQVAAHPGQYPEHAKACAGGASPAGPQLLEQLRIRGDGVNRLPLTVHAHLLTYRHRPHLPPSTTPQGNSCE